VFGHSSILWRSRGDSGSAGEEQKVRMIPEAYAVTT
jgi:hypothetical protein